MHHILQIVQTDQLCAAWICLPSFTATGNFWHSRFICSLLKI